MTQAEWLEVSLVVESELAEAVADVLARFASGGVVIQVDLKDWDAQGEGIPCETARVYGYLPVDESLAERRQRLEEALWYLSRIKPLPEPQFKEVQEVNWAESWKQHYHPIPIGKRLMITPAWLEEPYPGRIAVRIEPGMAFGTGTHPTTQLCLEMLETWFSKGELSSLFPSPFSGKIEGHDGIRIIDIGCGSGILSIAALKLGAEKAVGVDVDERAIQSARDNAKLNGVAERFELGRGSVKEILDGAYSIRKAQLVFANILAPVIIRLLDEGLSKVLEPSGRLLLSGILVEHAKDVEEAIRRNGLKVAERKQVGDWVALGVEKDTRN